MRFLHSADWHLGRLFHNISLLSDQEYILNQFLEIARDTKPDVVLIAGDIYDRAIPPPDAIRLLDDVLTRLVLGLEIPTILIAGNHDCPGMRVVWVGLIDELQSFQAMHVNHD
jgi:exonuclease SbcD